MESSKNTNWEPTCNRFVAFLDIMGFKDMVSRKKHADIYKMLESISKVSEEIAKQPEFASNNVYITTFSDSIVIFSKDDTQWSLQQFITAVTYMFANMMLRSIPVKGACAYGEISVNKKRAIFFGQPQIDAFLLQEDVNYYGIVCHNSYDKYLYDSKDEKTRSYLSYRLKTKLKSGDITHYNLDWFTPAMFIADDVSKSFSDDVVIEGIIGKLYFETSGSPRKYIDNTMEMYERYKEKMNGKEK